MPKKSPASSRTPTRRSRHLVVWLGLVGILAAIGYWLWPVPPRPSEPAPSATVTADYSPLIGRWQRTDGDYLIEIRSAASDGVLDAHYFNPGPIHVGKARALIDGGRLTALVELRDVNYPGSTYRLRHSGDKLAGEYFQATQGQTFEVEFVRVP